MRHVRNSIVILLARCDKVPSGLVCREIGNIRTKNQLSPLTGSVARISAIMAHLARAEVCGMGSHHNMPSTSSNAGTSLRVDRIFRAVGYGTILLLICFTSTLAAKIVFTGSLIGALGFLIVRKRRPSGGFEIQLLSPRSHWLVRTVNTVMPICFLTVLLAVTSAGGLSGIILSLPFLLPLLLIVDFLRSGQPKRGLALTVPMGLVLFFVSRTKLSIAHAWEHSWWDQFALFVIALAGVVMTCTAAWTYYSLPRESHDLRKLLAGFAYPFVVLVLFVLTLNPEDSPQAIHVEMAKRRLDEINKATSEYGKRFGGVFPRDLVALGSPPRNQKADCRAAGLLQKPFTTEGSCYIFEYRVGLPSSVALGGCEGVSQYTLTARPVAFKKTGDVNFYTDESGIIRCTFEDRQAGAHDNSFCDFSRHAPG